MLKRDKVINERKAEIKEIAEMAKKCLDVDLFKQYKGKYDVLKRNVMRELFEYPVNDPEYKAVIVKILARIEVLGMLCNDVEGDAKA